MTVLEFPKREITADPRRVRLGIRRVSPSKIGFGLDGFELSAMQAAKIVGEILAYLRSKA